jgi:protein involved in polysaccharide export with SLBB domain
MKSLLCVLAAVIAVGSAGSVLAQTPAPQGQASSQASAPASAPVGSTAPVVPPVTVPSPPPPPELIEMADGVDVPVYGSQLFTGAFSAARPTKGSDYLIQAGDLIAVRIFGAVNVDSVQTVDTSGSLFIQGIGPVNVGNTPVSALQSRLTTALRGVYNDTVGVYVDVLQGGTLGVFVTGDIRRPGRYLGSPSDTVLYFLDQAGGIDPVKGSFRNVTVSRGGQVVATFDLYDFLSDGRIERYPFRDGDVIRVGPRGAMVGVTGAGLNAYAFEAPRGAAVMRGSELLNLARPRSTVSMLAVSGVRAGLGQSALYALKDFGAVTLSDGDHVVLQSDIFTQSITVTLIGDLPGPSLAVMPKGSKLSQLLATVSLEGADVDPSYVYIERASVALQQKVALDKALDNLEKAALTAPASSSESATIASQQASQIERFVIRARQVQPSGNVSVYTNGQFNDLKLEAGDRVVFPPRRDVVIVAGEVISPGAFAHGPRATIRDYINRAGGFAPNANKGRFALRRPDGSALVAKASTVPHPGDEIVVVPSVVSPGFLLFKDITAIVFQMATTAAVVLSVTD